MTAKDSNFAAPKLLRQKHYRVPFGKGVGHTLLVGQCVPG